MQQTPGASDQSVKSYALLCSEHTLQPSQLVHPAEGKGHRTATTQLHSANSTILETLEVIFVDATDIKCI